MSNRVITVLRKPLVDTVARNVLRYGTGGINVDKSRVATSDTYAYPNGPGGKSYQYMSDKRSEEVRPNPTAMHSEGRWPANVILTENAATGLDNDVGVTRSTKSSPRTGSSGSGLGMSHTGAEYDDEGGVSRYFKVIRS